MTHAPLTRKPAVYLDLDLETDKIKNENQGEESHNLYTEFEDEIVNSAFQKNFYSKYKDSRLQFYSGTLQNCLKNVSLSKKPLIFYLHNENEEFSKNVCDLLAEKEVEDVIIEKFSIIAWNIKNENRIFIDALVNKIIIIDEVICYIKNKQACLFFIIPHNSSVKVHKCFADQIDKDTFLRALKEVGKFLSIYTSQVYFKTVTSVLYQEWMYEELGDRDFDSFERNEHKLLKDKILYALHGPPRLLEDSKIGYDEKEIKKANKIYKQIRSKNNEYAKWNDRIVIKFIYNCAEPIEAEKQKKGEKNKDYKPDEDFCPTPIFILRKCKGKNIDDPCCLFIDSDCRVYDNWSNYLKDNKLPPRNMIYPIDGKYRSTSEYDDVALDKMLSPSCGKTTKILKATDIGSGILGFASGITLVVGMFTPLAPVLIPLAMIAGSATGIYGIGRGTTTLIDRGTHAQSLNVTDSESRAAYLNIATGTFGVVGLGLSKLLADLANTGVNLGTSVQHTMTAFNSAQILVTGTDKINFCYDVIREFLGNEQIPSTFTLAQLSSSLFFFGNFVINFQTAEADNGEIDSATLSEISRALQSNRQRKILNKMLKQGDNRRSKQKPLVIATVRNSISKETLGKILIRANKNWDKNVKFSFDDENIKLNDIPVDILEFSSLPKSQQGVFLEKMLPLYENERSKNISDITTAIQNMEYSEKLLDFLNVSDILDLADITIALSVFKSNNQHEIVKICKTLMNDIDIHFIMSLRMIFYANIRNNIMQYVIDFVKRYAAIFKNLFESRLLNEDSLIVCQQFGFDNTGVTIMDFVDYVIEKFSKDKSMMDMLNLEFHSWCASLIYDKELRMERKDIRHHIPKKQKKDCLKCGGYYYVK